MREIIKNLPWNENTACIFPEGWQLRWWAAVGSVLCPLGNVLLFMQ